MYSHTTRLLSFLRARDCLVLQRTWGSSSSWYHNEERTAKQGIIIRPRREKIERRRPRKSFPGAVSAARQASGEASLSNRTGGELSLSHASSAAAGYFTCFSKHPHADCYNDGYEHENFHLRREKSPRGAPLRFAPAFSLPAMSPPTLPSSSNHTTTTPRLWREAAAAGCRLKV